MNGASLTLGLAALAALAGAAPKGTRNLALSDARRRDLDRFAEACGAFTREIGGHEPADMRRFAKKHGVRYLGSGYKRDVFSVPEGALKVERGHAPYGDNAREATLWAGAPARLAKLLVPVLATADDHRWNLMEEVEVGGKSTKLREEEFQACGLWDFYAPRNLSKDGRLVDYGYIYDPVSWRECLDKGSEQRGSRAMISPQALPEGLVVSITEAKSYQWRPIYKDVDWITVTISEEAGRLWRKGEVGGVLLLLRTRWNLWEIESIEASKGYGPLLYDLGMELAFLDGAKGIVPDRSGVSDRAESVWARYEETRPDVLRAALPQDYPDRDKHTLRHRPHLDLAYRKQGAPLLDALRRQGRLRAYGTPTPLVQRVVGSKG